MALESLQANKTSDGAGTAIQVTGPFTVIVPKNSVFNGAYLEVQLATENNAAEFELPDDGARIRAAGSVYFQLTGTNFVRTVQFDSKYDTSISADLNQ